MKLPSGITSVAASAFEDCSGLTTLNLPDVLASIGKSAFAGCKNLKKITLSANLTSIGSKAFDNCVPDIIVAKMATPPVAESDAFSDWVKNNTTLCIPQGSYMEYWVASTWEDFKHIVEMDSSTGIEAAPITTASEAKEVARYSVDGQRLSTPVKGLNIVKYSDGTTKKIMVK